MERELVTLDGPDAPTLALDAATGKPPREIRIFALGKTASRKGEYVYDAESAKTIAQAEQHKSRQPWSDYEHQSLHVPPIEAPASSIYDLEFRDDGMWATNIKWRPRAAKLVGEGEYLFLSPAFYRDKDTGRVLEFINFALTNDPATKSMRPLSAARAALKADSTPEEKSKMGNALIVALTGKEDADESAALSNAMQLVDFRRELLTLTERSSASEAYGVIAAWKQSQTQVVALTEKVAALEAITREEEVNKLIAQGTASSQIEPALLGWATELGRKDIVALRSYLEKAPKKLADSPARPSQPTGVATPIITDEGRRVARGLGLKPEELLAHMNKVRAEQADSDKDAQ